MYILIFLLKIALEHFLKNILKKNKIKNNADIEDIVF